VFIGVDNVGDKQLPIGLNGAGAGSGILENIGRKYYAGVNFDF
jgi:outer membrane receptor for ferrienterochelin and colicin